MSYIDVDKFAEKICDFQAIDENAANAMIWLLRTFPTADVVSVVRCKDCRHWTPCGGVSIDANGTKWQYGECSLTKMSLKENEYCSFGKSLELSKENENAR